MPEAGLPTTRGAADAAGAETLLVIGVHREELAFGERVALTLTKRGSLSGLRLLRIGEGISGQHPRADQRFHYEVLHRAIYRQIRELAKRHRLVIDLHRGEDDQGPCADVICADDRLLRCIESRSVGARRRRDAASRDRVRTVQLTAGGEPAPPGTASARTVIPPEVWDSPDFLFVGVEVYLASAGVGSGPDWDFTAGLIVDVMECARAASRAAARD